MRTCPYCGKATPGLLDQIKLYGVPRFVRGVLWSAACAVALIGLVAFPSP